MIIGDMFYWTVTIQGAESKRYVAVNARDYSLADEYRPEEKPQAWAEYAKYLFPFELSFTSPLDGYVKPRIAEVSFQALWLGLALGAFYALIRRRSPADRLWQTVGVVLFGLFLFVPLLVFGTANDDQQTHTQEKGGRFRRPPFYHTQFPGSGQENKQQRNQNPRDQLDASAAPQSFRAAHHHQPGKHDYDQSR